MALRRLPETLHWDLGGRVSPGGGNACYWLDGGSVKEDVI